MKELYNKVLKDGGFTADYDLELKEFNNGYMVSVEGKEKTINKNDIRGFEDAIIETRGEITGDNEYIGAWLDKDIIYIDVSIKIDDLQEARAEARANNQLAIYDLKENNSLYM